FVAEFIGAPAMNLISTAVIDCVATVGGARLVVPRSNDSDRVIVGVRPESWDLAGGDDVDAVSGPVELGEVVGAESFVYAAPPGAEEEIWRTRATQLVVRVDRRVRMQAGTRIGLRPRPDEVLYFSAVTGDRLS